MKKKIIVALGSNYEQEKNVLFAMDRLRELFPDFAFSRMLWTDPIGIESDKFVNALGWGMVEKSQDEIVEILKGIEKECGRKTEDKARNLVRIDLDLLLYDKQRFREGDWKRDYIITLLKESEELL